MLKEWAASSTCWRAKKGGTLYIGVTSDLSQRVHDHSLRKRGFTAKYGAVRLVWYEEHDDITDAIQREKSLKRWKQQWKIDLIESINPDWSDLYRGIGW